MFPIRDHNPSEGTPFVTNGLIFANVAVFLLTWGWAGGSGVLGARLALYPVAVIHGEYLWGLVTHMFMHAGLLHLGGNMLFLWIFGDNLEDQMGHLGFLVFYLACGLAAAAAQIAANPWEAIPMVGASGAIAGVMGGYLLLFPRAKVDVIVIIVFIIRRFVMPAWLVLAIWFVLQVVATATMRGGDGGVAYWAHSGGFLAGMALTLPVFLRRGGTRFWRRTNGHPPHLPLDYAPTRIPQVRR